METREQKTIEELRAETFMSVYGVSKISDIVKMFEKDYNQYKNKGLKELQGLYKKYSYGIFFMYSPSAIRNNLVKFKQVIKANGGKYQAIALDDFNVEEIYKPIKTSDTKRKQALKAKVRAGESQSQQTDPKVVIGLIKGLRDILNNKEYVVRGNQNEKQVRAYYLLAILSLSGGRRFAENLKTLKVKQVKDKIYFQGLLKNNIDKIEANIIELDHLEFRAYLRELQKYANAKDLTVADINKKYAKVFNNAMKKLSFQNVKSLRHNYTIAGATLFKREGETVEDTITRILGHKETFTSALNYT